MSRKVKAMLNLHYMDTRHSFVIFWSILIGIFALSCILAYQFPDNRVMMSSWSAVYIYSLIGGLLTVNITLPVALGWSVTRRDYYAATVIHYILVCLALSVLYMIMYGIEKWLISVNPHMNFQSFSLIFLENRPIWFSLWFHFIIALSMVSSGHVVGSLYYRFGKIGIFALMAFGLLLSMLFHLLDIWGAFFRLLQQIDSLAELTLWLIPYVFICFLLGWLFIRRAPAKMGA